MEIDVYDDVDVLVDDSDADDVAHVVAAVVGSYTVDDVDAVVVVGGGGVDAVVDVVADAVELVVCADTVDDLDDAHVDVHVDDVDSNGPYSLEYSVAD